MPDTPHTPHQPIAPDSIVGAVMDRRPATLAVFMRHRMHCPGCVMAGFMTVAEAAASHRIDLETLLADLNAEAEAEAEAEAAG